MAASLRVDEGGAGALVGQNISGEPKVGFLGERDGVQQLLLRWRAAHRATGRPRDATVLQGELLVDEFAAHDHVYLRVGRQRDARPLGQLLGKGQLLRGGRHLAAAVIDKGAAHGPVGVRLRRHGGCCLQRQRLRVLELLLRGRLRTEGLVELRHWRGAQACEASAGPGRREDHESWEKEKCAHAWRSADATKIKSRVVGT